MENSAFERDYSNACEAMPYSSRYDDIFVQAIISNVKSFLLGAYHGLSKKASAKLLR